MQEFDEGVIQPAANLGPRLSLSFFTGHLLLEGAMVFR